MKYVSTSLNEKYLMDSLVKSKFFTSSALILFTSILVYQYITFGPFAPLQCQLLRIGCLDTEIHGYVAPEFIDVKKAFIKNFENGYEIGSSVAVYYDGNLVVDLQGGYADLEAKRKYDNNTLQPVFSSTKVMSAIMIAYLVDRGFLDYNKKVSTYWPEFAQGNKENVTLLDLVNHRAGLSYLNTKVTKSDLEDLDKFAKTLASQPHSFNGVSSRAYHATTVGWYLNEIVRRVDPKHRTIGKIISDEILEQYDLEFYLLLPPNFISRVAKLYEISKIRGIFDMFNVFFEWWIGMIPNSYFSEFNDKESVMYKTFQPSGPFKISDFSDLETLTVEWPSVNGITNAKSMAKLGAIIVNNGQPINSVTYKPLISKSTIDLMSTKLPETFDHVLYKNITPASGGFAYLRYPGIEDVEFIGWGGYGGSSFIWNRELGISFGYAMNGLLPPKYGKTGDLRLWSVLKEVVNVAKKLKKEQA
ncbi:5663_t:CDS:2 [Scutellospora calospora]|uniref:5663_t:CDS:1 n=1 Tax=Scutellospora calospora TaxID=85575 RepID=A0ACA9JV77_9GLOM|nr:5663_t:CDS:2 [Scutellospora calospora]